MTQQNQTSSTRKTIGIAILLVVSIATFSLFFVSYWNAVALILGIIAYFQLKIVINDFLDIIKNIRNPSNIAKLLLMILLIILCSILFVFPPLYYTPPLCGEMYYQVKAMPETSQLDNIKIQEYVIVNDNSFFPFHPPSDWIKVTITSKSGFQLPERKATIRNRGLLLKEVIVSPPLDCSASYGSKASVELNDFPINSFYAAHNAQGLQKFPYLDTETVTWNSDNLEIKFSYIPPPFQILRPLLKPLIGASTVNQWVMGIIGFIGTIVFIPIIKPVLIDAMQKILKNRMDNTEKSSKPIAKLIVSDKGDEKEIEIKKGKK